MYIPEKPAPMPAGHYPSHVAAACAVCEVDPAELLAWSVRADAVVLVLPSGAKVTFAVEGAWEQERTINREAAKARREEMSMKEEPRLMPAPAALTEPVKRSKK